MTWLIGTTLTVVATAALVGSERADSPLRKLWKPLASVGFLAVALVDGVPEDLFGRLLLAGLIFSFVGDVALLGSSEWSFLAGLAAFLLAHLWYGGAFWAAGPSWPWALASVVVLAGALAAVGRWLLPSVTGRLRVPVIVYMVVITLMVALAFGTVGGGSSLWLAIGAGLFYLSDLAVARQEFVAPGFVNRAWGLPVYYAAQLILAASI